MHTLRIYLKIAIPIFYCCEQQSTLQSFPSIADSCPFSSFSLLLYPIHSRTQYNIITSWPNKWFAISIISKCCLLFAQWTPVLVAGCANNVKLGKIFTLLNTQISSTDSRIFLTTAPARSLSLVLKRAYRTLRIL